MNLPDSTNSTEGAQSVATRYPQRHLAACMLPWTEDDRLDIPVFEEHVQQAIDRGFRSIYLMGTAGEGYAMTDARFREVVEVFAAKTVRDGCDPQVGVISLSMEQVIDRIGVAHDHGIRMFQISLPGWGALDDAEMLLFFETVCGAFPDSRFLHYNLPRAQRVITGVEYRAIVDRAPNLVATKNSTTDYARTADLMTHVPELQHFLLESNFAMGCTLGECSLLCSYNVLFPETTQRFFEAGVRKDFAELFRITKLFRDVGQRLFAHCQRSMIDGSYDKTYAWLRNPRFSNRVLPPYLGLSEEESRMCRDVYDKHYSGIT